MALLAFDIGNTQTTIGLWRDGEWRQQWRLQTAHDRTADEYGIFIKSLLREGGFENLVNRVAISSVVPALTGTMTQACERYLKAPVLEVRYDIPLGITVATENPAEVGADRIANAVGAFRKYQRACIVIDMGTATTFDVVSAEGNLLGVVISPGLRLAADALTGRAARLSGVALQAPPQVVGRNTVHAIQAGLIFGYAGLVEGIVRRLKAEIGDPDLLVIGTGGLISLISAEVDVIDELDPYLTLDGIRLINELNEDLLAREGNG
jgi:type III pantothenate kinase